MVRTKDRLAEANKKNSKGKKGGGSSGGSLSGDALKTALKGEVSARVRLHLLEVNSRLVPSEKIN